MNGLIKKVTSPTVHLPEAPRLTQSPLAEAAVAEAPDFTAEELAQAKGFSPEKANPYVRIIGGVEVDVYRILRAWAIKEPGVQHAIKKLLRGGRADKTEAQDIAEAIQALQRTLEIMEEEA